MKKRLFIFLIIGLIGSVLNYAGGDKKSISSEEALQKLVDGNLRFVNGASINPNQSSQDIERLSKGQYPFAIILSCSDSRIPPEIVFDQGLGDLFVIRTAGEVVDSIGIGSIEYAAEHLHVSLIVVLGHGKCGAVTAAHSDGEVEGYLNKIVNDIRNNISSVNREENNSLEKAIDVNTKSITHQLRESKPVISELVEHGKVKVVPAYYDITTGKVDFFK
ncbi:MAG: carbonic anhydrase [Ignavibacteria bacterium]|nr:carbonic anhydrase [Ignavibacteria bacterium]